MIPRILGYNAPWTTYVLIGLTALTGILLIGTLCANFIPSQKNDTKNNKETNQPIESTNTRVSISAW